jgi:hypothetical protein
MVGRARRIVLECDQAIGPYARDQWRDLLEKIGVRGKPAERFEVERFSVRQSDLGEG